MPAKAEFSTLPGFSKLYRDFFKNDSFVWQRFPANHVPKETFAKRLAGFKNRAAMLEIFSASMANVTLAPEQKKNLELLKNENSLVVISGQQVGLFGGALYTFFKAQSAIAHARQFARECGDKNFIPVFWVEDNDHDRAEAELATVLTESCELLPLKAPGDLVHQPNATIGAIRLTDEITPLLEDLSQQLPASPHRDDITQLLKKIYTPGKLWSDAYTELLHHFFKDTGLLFVKGSEVRRSGLSREILLQELANAGGAKSVVQSAGAEIVHAGYHVQAEPSDVHLFLHEGEQRFKINIYNGQRFSANGRNFTREELLKTAGEFPERFSPNVLLRPIVQDAVFPTAAYVAGPGELSYAAELCEMYGYFGVEMPMFVPRHSATFVEFAAEKLFLKEKISPVDVMKPWQDVEKMFTEKISDPLVNALFKKNSAEAEIFFKNLSERAVEIDKTLAGAVAATKTVTEKQYAKLLKKVNAAQKRRESELFKKYREAWTMTFPGGLQERVFSVVHYLAEYGETELRSALELFNKEPAIAHYFVILKKS